MSNEDNAGYASLAWAPPRPESISQQVYRRLREAIIAGSIAPGTRLREVELSQTMNVSRTPLREAIARLISDRLVAKLPHGGVEVVDTARELHDIYHIRTALEGCAARLAADRIEPAELDALRKLADQSTALPYEAVEQRIAVNTAFHDALTRASGSPRLIEMIDGFREFFLNERGLRRFDRDETDHAVGEHHEIIDALARRDGEAAEKLVRDHFLGAYETAAKTSSGS